MVSGRGPRVSAEQPRAWRPLGRPGLRLQLSVDLLAAPRRQASKELRREWKTYRERVCFPIEPSRRK